MGNYGTGDFMDMFGGLPDRGDPSHAPDWREAADRARDEADESLMDELARVTRGAQLEEEANARRSQPWPTEGHTSRQVSAAAKLPQDDPLFVIADERHVWGEEEEREARAALRGQQARAEWRHTVHTIEQSFTMHRRRRSLRSRARGAWRAVRGVYEAEGFEVTARHWWSRREREAARKAALLLALQAKPFADAMRRDIERQLIFGSTAFDPTRSAVLRDIREEGGSDTR